MGATDLTIAPVEATEGANTGFPAGDILADVVEAVVLDTTGVVAAFTVGPAVMLGAAAALGGAYASEAVVEWVGEVAGAVGDVLEHAGSAITDPASDIEDAASDAVDGVEDFLF